MTGAADVSIEPCGEIERGFRVYCGMCRERVEPLLTATLFAVGCLPCAVRCSPNRDPELCSSQRVSVTTLPVRVPAVRVIDPAADPDGSR